MLPAPLPDNESLRLDALHRHQILDTPPEVSFDDLACLAARVCETPIALISLVDGHRQWFKARIGLTIPETARNDSFCAHAVYLQAPLIVPDTLLDPRFADGPLVVDSPWLRFYAGFPLVTSEGHALGALCVCDTVPRTLTDCQLDSLGRLARQVVGLLELRRSALELAKSRVEAQESEERFRTMADGAPVMIWMSGPGAVRTYFNDGWLFFTGRSLEDELGHGWTAGIHPDDFDRCLQSYLGAFERCEPFELEYRIRDRRGEYRVLSDRGVPRYLADGTLAGFIGACTDITDTRRASDLLEQERFTLGQIIAKAPVAMALFDTEMRYVAWSRRWVEDYQVAEGRDLKGVSHYEVFPDIPDRWRELHRRALAGEALADPEDRFERATGEQIHLRWAIHPWHTAEGKVGGVIMVTDVINDLVQSRIAALESSRLKSEFLASMSHEIRTPMNGVIGMVDLLFDTPLTEEQREFAGMIQSSARGLLGIINDILDFSKLEAGKLAIEMIAFNLRTVVEDVADLFSPQVVEKGLELVLRYGWNEPECFIGDPGRIRQVLINLIGNGIKFTERGQVVVTVRSVRRGDGAVVRIEIADTGMGIPKGKQLRIFDKFVQGDASSTRKFGGTGLGLSISRQLVELMRGGIGLESVERQGTTFWVELPLAVDSDAPPSRSIALAKPLTVLVAEDDACCGDVVSEMLRHLGCAVVAVTDAASATEQLRRAARTGTPFDVALVDHTLPGLPTGGMASSLVAGAGTTTSLILMTGLASATADGFFRQLGFADFVRKPVRLEQLAAALNATIRAARGRDQRPTPMTEAVTRPDASTGPRVLVVDDNVVNQRVAAGALLRLGCQVETAAHGGEAVELVREGGFDLVFMDCMMPEMDGYDATAAIRRFPGGRGRIPIVAVTANALPGDRERCLSAGMDDYLAKPIRLDDLKRALARWVGRDPAAASA